MYVTGRIGRQLKMAQTKTGSALETILNIGSGMFLAFSLMQFLLVPLLGLDNFTIDKNIIVTIVLTIASIIRSYVWRRVFINYFKG